MSGDLPGSGAPGPNLTACDREPIHIPGSIQPHGLLLIASMATGKISLGAGDLETRLVDGWLGSDLDDLLDQPVFALLQAAPEAHILTLGSVTGTAERFDAVAHRLGATVAVELEPAQQSPRSAAETLSWLEAASRAFERAATLRELCVRAANTFQRLTGYDRVMVYRFLDDQAGVVLAEARRPELGSFLNHHFPATDIPQQARALYVRNRVRVIPDVNYRPAPLRPSRDDVAVLDMSDLALRSVSPIHLQYLRNMGVAASASVSIVRDGSLWGLIACHNHSPQGLSLDQRLACDALAGNLSRQIKALDEAEHFRERLRLRALEDELVARFAEMSSTDDFFAQAGEELRTLLSADGFAAVQGCDRSTVGHCPPAAELARVASWVQPHAVSRPFSTHRLSQAYPRAEIYQQEASGLLAATLSSEPPTTLMWFRAEAVEVVNWAGNPHKANSLDPNAVLTPRTSFEAWSQDVRGQSRPWTLLEAESAERLTRSIFEARQTRRVRDLNVELSATVADNQRLLLQKDYLLKEVNHRVQNSLQLVSSFLALQSREADDERLTLHLEEAQRRLSAVALVHRRLYKDDRVETVDLARYLEELCADINGSTTFGGTDHLSLRLAPILVSADRALNIGLIVTELLINANKYAYGGLSGPVSVSLDQDGNRFRLSVSDSGVGRQTVRGGFGSRMIAAMAATLSGTVEDLDNDPGLRVVVTAPIS